MRTTFVRAVQDDEGLVWVTRLRGDGSEFTSLTYTPERYGFVKPISVRQRLLNHIERGKAAIDKLRLDHETLNQRSRDGLVSEQQHITETKKITGAIAAWEQLITDDNTALLRWPIETS